MGVPIFYISGSDDGLVTPDRVQRQFDDTSAELDKVFAEVTGHGHMDLAESVPFAWFSAAFFNCYLQNKQCEAIYQNKSSAWCPLCDLDSSCPHQWPMTVCDTHRGSPAPRVYERLTATCQNAVAISGELAVSSVQECEALCDKQDGCVAVDTDGKSCYLKSHCEGSFDSASTCTFWCAYRLKKSELAI